MSLSESIIAAASAATSKEAGDKVIAAVGYYDDEVVRAYFLHLTEHEWQKLEQGRRKRYLFLLARDLIRARLFRGDFR